MFWMNLKKKITDRLKQLTIGYVNDQEMIDSLRKQGVTIGERVRFFAPHTITVDVTKPYMIKIGNDVQITAGVTILTHGYDWSVVKGLTGEILGSCGEVVIGNNVFIGTKSTILKEVHIGDNVIIGANSLVNKDCESGYVYAGVPAKKIMSIEEYAEKMRKKQFIQAYNQFKCYYEKYNELPKKDMFDEFFFMFEDRSSELIEKFDKKLKLLGNYEKSKEKFLSREGQMFENYEQFCSKCMEKFKLEHKSYIESEN